MFIGICDDDNIMRERIERVCKDVTKKYNEETIIKKYKDGQEITDRNAYGRWYCSKRKIRDCKE